VPDRAGGHLPDVLLLLPAPERLLLLYGRRRRARSRRGAGSRRSTRGRCRARSRHGLAHGRPTPKLLGQRPPAVPVLQHALRRLRPRLVCPAAPRAPRDVHDVPDRPGGHLPDVLLLLPERLLLL